MTALNPNSEASHDASMAKGRSSLLLAMRGLSMVVAGLGSDGDDTLVAEATDFFEQAIQGDDPELAKAIKGLAHQLSSLVGPTDMNAVRTFGRTPTPASDEFSVPALRALLRAPAMQRDSISLSELAAMLRRPAPAIDSLPMHEIRTMTRRPDPVEEPNGQALLMTRSFA